jgi:repressor LexA
MNRLGMRQERVLRFIKWYIATRGYPPTCEEIRAGLALKSTSMVHRDLAELEKAGRIERTRGVRRGLRLARPVRQVFAVPLLGTIAAGEPIGFGDPVEEAIFLTTGIVDQQDGLFALKVKGDSMIDALVNDGDIIILRHQSTAQNGDMVAVRLLDRDETTLKHFYRENGHVRLQPANPTLEPIFVHPAHVEIQGQVVAIVRQLEKGA